MNEYQEKKKKKKYESLKLSNKAVNFDNGILSMMFKKGKSCFRKEKHRDLFQCFQSTRQLLFFCYPCVKPLMVKSARSGAEYFLLPIGIPQ
jgi:hypothetical protein